MKPIRLKFFEPNKIVPVKASIHKTGKLGFAMDAAKRLGLQKGKYSQVGINQDDPNDKNLYLIVVDKDADGCFKIAKAGEYYYINLKHVFDKMNIDYSKDVIAYDISEQNYDGQLVWKLTPRKTVKR